MLLLDTVTVLDAENMDWLPRNNSHKPHCKSLGTHNLASVCRSQGDSIRDRALIFVYIIGDVAHTPEPGPVRYPDREKSPNQDISPDQGTLSREISRSG